MYADAFGLLVFGASLTSAAFSKTANGIFYNKYGNFKTNVL